MPVTRSGILRTVSPSNEVNEDRSDSVDLRFHLSQAQIGVIELQTETDTLRRENEKLRTDLDKLYESENKSIQPKRGKKAGPSNSALQAQVKKLNIEVARLKAARREDKRKIRKLEAKEVRAEAQDLQEGGDQEDEDVTHKFRKLLRVVEDLVTANSYEENETCPVCFEAFEVDKCRSLTCDHIFCNDCLQNITSGKSLVVCPTCRKECQEEDIQPIRFSAREQWDRLVGVVSIFASIDTRRGELDTTDEEIDEETAANFIDDDEAMTNSEADPPDTPSGDNSAEASTPPQDHQVDTEPESYAQSPTAVKRKRLEELARQRKRRV